MTSPEALARENIDRQLSDAGWAVQDVSGINLHAERGVAVREFPLKSGYGHADYLLYVDGKAAGVIEAKPEGATLTGVEVQSEKYGDGLPDGLPAHRHPLPFLYQSTGIETRFTNGFDPEPRSRDVFTFHRPATFARWVAGTRPRVAAGTVGVGSANLRTGLQDMPPIPAEGLWPPQLKAVRNLERSLANNRPRALIQMATGSGKTFAAVTSIYRLIKYGGAHRVLFLVDRANLGRQALREFQQYDTPDDGRKFTELYNVQHLTSNHMDDVARVSIATIQRVYSMLQGEEDLPEEADEASLAGLSALMKEPVPVVYSSALPIEFFDVVFIDECHRSIYTLWKQVLDYFDAFLIGLTATPSKQTLGFFKQNLVMEYGHEEAVVDRVNVDFDVYRIRTKITEQGSKVEAGHFVDRRERQSRRKRWEQLDEDLEYGSTELDKEVVAPDQIRTVIRSFKEKLFTEIFPGRTDVPKTLIFAKDDSLADDIVQIVREEFGKGNDFAQKITYRTTGKKTDDLISEFRNSYNPRIAVTVDMMATGTDVKPLEVVMFMRAVKSRVLFEQMKGRGVRVIGETDFRSVTPDAAAKTRFVIVDCVGVCEQDLADTRPLERKPTVSFIKLMRAISMGSTDPDVVSTLAGRLSRLDLQLTPDERRRIGEAAKGQDLRQITATMIRALDPDRLEVAARERYDLEAGVEPSEELIEETRTALVAEAVKPIAANPDLRNLLLEIKRSKEQTIDVVSVDELLGAAYSEEAKEKAKSLTQSFERFIEENRDEITALQILYSSPRARRLTYEDIRTLADAIQLPPRGWTPEVLWRAYETLDASRVRGAPTRVLSNIVSLVRYAMHQDDRLEPFPDVAAERFEEWVSRQEAHGRRFTDEQRRWLEMIRDHIAANLEMTREDFDTVPFIQRGGLAAAHRVFGGELDKIMDELAEVLAA